MSVQNACFNLKLYKINFSTEFLKYLSLIQNYIILCKLRKGRLFQVARGKYGPQ